MVQVFKKYSSTVYRRQAEKRRSKLYWYPFFLSFCLICSANTHTVSASDISRQVDREKREIDRVVTWVWQEVKRRGNDRVDWDRNGVVNCCDRAVSFIREWKKYSSREIRLCEQQTSKMNHMYVQIYMGWGWWSIDPCYTTSGSHDMQKVWSGNYSKWDDNPYGYWSDYFRRWTE